MNSKTDTLSCFKIVRGNRVEPRTIVRAVASSGRPATTNDTLMYLKQLFNHAIKLGLLTYNPAAAFSVTDAGGMEKSRDRALSLEEISKIFKVFGENSEYDYFDERKEALTKVTELVVPSIE